MEKMAIAKFAMENDGNAIKWMAKMADYDSEYDIDSDSVKKETSPLYYHIGGEAKKKFSLNPLSHFLLLSQNDIRKDENRRIFATVLIINTNNEHERPRNEPGDGTTPKFAEGRLHLGNENKNTLLFCIPLGLDKFLSFGKEKSFSFLSLIRNFALPLASPKVGCTSGMKIKTRFYFAFRSVCTTFAL